MSQTSRSVLKKRQEFQSSVLFEEPFLDPPEGQENGEDAIHHEIDIKMECLDFQSPETDFEYQAVDEAVSQHAVVHFPQPPSLPNNLVHKFIQSSSEQGTQELQLMTISPGPADPNLHSTQIIPSSNLPSFVCNKCDASFGSLSKLESHMAGPHCALCPSFFTSPDQLNRHMDASHKNFLPNIRLVRLSKVKCKTALKHVDRPKSVWCSLCDKFFGSKFARNQHLLKFHSVTTSNLAESADYFCGSCTRCFSTESQWTNHVSECELRNPSFALTMKVYVERAPKYYCRICNVGLSSQLRMQRHMMSEHVAKNPDVSDSDPESEPEVIGGERKEIEERVCRFCGGKFLEQSEFSTHLNENHRIMAPPLKTGLFKKVTRIAQLPSKKKKAKRKGVKRKKPIVMSIKRAFLETTRPQRAAKRSRPDRKAVCSSDNGTDDHLSGDDGTAAQHEDSDYLPSELDEPPSPLDSESEEWKKETVAKKQRLQPKKAVQDKPATAKKSPSKKIVSCTELDHNTLNKLVLYLWKCSYCGLECDSAFTLLDHCSEMHQDVPRRQNPQTRTGNIKGKFLCDECGMRYSIAKELTIHKLRHFQDLKCIPCRFCPKLCFDVQAVVTHLRRAHSEEVIKLINSGVNLLACSFCDKDNFDSIYGLRKHLLKHSTTSKLKSVPGRYIMKNPTYLHRFKDTKTGDIMITRDPPEGDCTLAEKGMRQLFKDFICNMCGVTMSKLDEVYEHSQAVHNDVFVRVNVLNKKCGSHLCRDCGHGFETVTELKWHEIRHRGVQPFPCSFCDSFCPTIASLFTHLEYHHFDEAKKTFPILKNREKFKVRRAKLVGSWRKKSCFYPRPVVSSSSGNRDLQEVTEEQHKTETETFLPSNSGTDTKNIGLPLNMNSVGDNSNHPKIVSDSLDCREDDVTTTGISQPERLEKKTGEESSLDDFHADNFTKFGPGINLESTVKFLEELEEQENEKKRRKSFKFPNKLAALLGLKSGVYKRRVVCDLCNLNFRNVIEVVLHAEIEHAANKFKITSQPKVKGTLCCLECGASYKQAIDLHFHTLRHRGVNCLQCPICEFTMNSPVRYRFHVLQYHTVNQGLDRPIDTLCQCMTCREARISENWDKVEKHSISQPGVEDAKTSVDIAPAALRAQAPPRRTSAEPKFKFPCKHCHVVLKNKVDLVRHLRRQHKKDYACNKCGSVFHSRASIFLHLRTHFPDLKYECKLCNTSYDRHRLWFLHFCRDEYGNAHICSICSRSFNRVHLLKQHRYKHRQNIKCNICHMVCSSRTTYNNHIMVKHESKKCLCPICGQGFALEKQLDNHLERHRTEKYQCKKCPRKFLTRRDLNNHNNREHKRNCYICQICNLALGSKQTYGIHMSRHEGAMLYSCDICHKPYSTAPAVKYHMKKFHNHDKL